MKYKLTDAQIEFLRNNVEFKDALLKARLRNLNDEIELIETYLRKSENDDKIEVNSKLAWELYNGTD